MDISAAQDRLIIRHELRRVNTVILAGQAMTIGRSARCDIPLQHEAVSRNHAKLERHPDGWHIVDTGSVNGVRVNGRPVTSAHLRSGDVIEIRPFAMNYLAAETGVEDRSIQLANTIVGEPSLRRSRDVGFDIRQRLEDLYTIAGLVIHRKDDGTFWLGIHQALRRTLAADRCVIVAFSEGAPLYRLAPQMRPTDSHTPLEVSRSVLDDVVASRQGLLIRQVSQEVKYAEAHSLVASQAGSVLCVPVVVEGRTRAVVYAERHATRPAFQKADLDFAMAAVDLAATSVSIDELQSHAQELSRIKGRLDAAREIQETLLPDPVPQPSWGSVAARNEPAEQVSGDIYDVRLDAQGRLVVMLADVAGKGVPAAFVTAILHSCLRQALTDIDDLETIVRRLNETIEAYNLPSCFVTMVLFRWSADASFVEIANCGHPVPLWVWGNGRTEAFPERIGVPLGVMPEWQGKIVKRTCDEPFVVLITSDGSIEAASVEREEFGEERLASTFWEVAGEAPDQIISRVVEQVRAHCQPQIPADDLTLVAVKRPSREPSKVV